MKIVSENKAFGGRQLVVSHPSDVCRCDMTFGLFLPKEALKAPVPVLWYLSGLTCSHENAMVKAGAQGWAAREGIAVVFPDTSPRGEVADDAAFDLGQGAGFYVDATEAPWAANYKMWSYVTDELPALVFGEFALDAGRQAVTGHSMGGHGALTMALSLPRRFRSVSAFAPICNPVRSDWGRKQFAAYLGPDEAVWAGHDAVELLEKQGLSLPLLVDQGSADKFLDLLGTDSLEAAVAGTSAVVRRQAGYDHSYFFVSTFMEDHVSFHAKALKA
jgi:S-formylglutathione hydrolase